MENSFKKKFDFEQRLTESTKIMKKYESRVPVIVLKSSRSRLPDIDKNKYLVPAELTIAQFLHIIRKRININSNQSIFVFIDDTTLPPTSSTFNRIYLDHKDKDGFLYLTYCEENTFG